MRSPQAGDGAGLKGWVRNRADNSVEAMSQESSEMVEAMIARAHGGSPASRVADVVVGKVDTVETMDQSDKRPTA